jgi:hypothetical protein
LRASDVVEVVMEQDGPAARILAQALPSGTSPHDLVRNVAACRTETGSSHAGGRRRDGFSPGMLRALDEFERALTRNGHVLSDLGLEVLLSLILGHADEQDMQILSPLNTRLAAGLLHDHVVGEANRRMGQTAESKQPSAEGNDVPIPPELAPSEDLTARVRSTADAGPFPFDDGMRLCGIAVDHGTRVISPNDCIDTAEDTWEEDVISACRDHVSHNAHTSKRLKKKLMIRFRSYGGATACEIFGYIKPPGAKTYDDWQRNPDATPIFLEWFRRLREEPNCSAVADWLNETGVPTGKYCRRETWNGPMVRRITANPMLKGVVGRGFKVTVKHNELGRRISVKNPDGPIFRDCPHLAHVPAILWDEVNALLDHRNERFGHKPIDGLDPRYRVPRKRTRFPGQHARCWYCGRQFVWGGNGVTDNLMCNGARESKCWNSIGFNGALASQKLVSAITDLLYRLDGFEEQFRAIVQRAQKEGGSDLGQRWAQLQKDEQLLNQGKANLVAAIEKDGPQEMFSTRLTEIDRSAHDLARVRRELETLQGRSLELPGSAGQLREMLEAEFQRLASDSPEFGALMRQLVPDFHVYLVRLCDRGHLLPRARIKLNLGGSIADTAHVPELTELLTKELTIDLFEPPQRERIRNEVVRLTAENSLNQREIARHLSESATQTAVQHALALDREVRKRGLDSAFVLVDKPPADYAKLRRYRDPKFHFEPIEGYAQPPLWSA